MILTRAAPAEKRVAMTLIMTATNTTTMDIRMTIIMSTTIIMAILAEVRRMIPDLTARLVRAADTIFATEAAFIETMARR